MFYVFGVRFLVGFIFSKSTKEIMGERVVEWSDLPMELLPVIGKTLQARIDVIRFRSICTSWRFSIPPPPEISPLPLPFPYPTSSGSEAFLSQSTIYLLEPPDENPNPSSKSWLVKVEESEDGTAHSLDPLFCDRYWFPTEDPDPPKVINLLDFRVIEVSKAYKLLQFSSDMHDPVMNKLVLFPNSAWNTSVEDTLIFVLFHDGKLRFLKYGDENWTLVDDLYDDIIVYKGKVYAVNRWGKVSWIHSSMKLIQFSPPLHSFGNQKHLVESCGELYVVVRFDENINYNPSNYGVKTVAFIVYKLDQEWGCREVKDLGDRVFILLNDCSFSVSAREFPGCEGNCIFFTDEDNIGVFYLSKKNQRFVMDMIDDRCCIFCPPSNLI
jgi:hypothetical protein